MSRRALQSAGIVLVFLIAFVAVTLIGVQQGQTELSMGETGILLEDKQNWEEAVTSLPQMDETSTVYVTQSGTKYHVSPGCPGLRNAKEIIGTPLAFAIEQEKTLCSLCEEG